MEVKWLLLSIDKKSQSKLQRQSSDRKINPFSKLGAVPKSSVKIVYMNRGCSNSMGDSQLEISNECVENYVRRKESLQFVLCVVKS